MNKSIAGLLLTLTTCLLLAAGPALAQVYKTVDKDGNVVYTDQPPTPDAQPVELPGLSVIESLPYTTKKPAVPEAAQAEEQVTDIRELRRGYKDFRISSPAHEETIQGTGNSVTLAWDASYALQPGMAVVFELDGVPLDPVASSSVNLQAVDRGEHTVRAKLIDSDLRIIAQASPVTFYVWQNSRLFRRP